jgi:hypothetical protein
MRMERAVAKPIRKMVGVLSSLLLISMPLNAQGQGSSAKVAVASIVEREFNFGNIPQGSKVTHEFEIENRGGADLIIERLTPSCGCTATTVTAPVVKPATTEKIRVEFDSSGFSGAKVKTVEVLTNDRENRKVLLTLKGSVVPGFSAQPSRIEFGALSPSAGGDERIKRLKIEIIDKSREVECRVRSFSKFLLARSVQEVSSSEPTFEVEILPDAPKGEFRERVLVECKGGQQPLSIPVTAFIQGDLRLKPGVLSFGVVSGNQVLQRKAILENSSLENIVVEQVVASHEAVKASYHQASHSRGGKGEAGVVVVTVDPSKVKGPLQATVTLVTSHPVEKEVVITVTGVIPPQ